MGWTFRRSRKIGPGLRLNISKSSLGLSGGRRGGRVSANTRGQKGVSLGAFGFRWFKRWR